MNRILILLDTYLLFLFIEVIDDNTNKQVERKEGPKDDEEDKVQIHVQIDFTNRLLSDLKKKIAS